MRGEIRNFYNFCNPEAWKEDKSLAVNVYILTKDFSKQELFELTSQSRRLAVSIHANIDEGFERYHFKDKIRFFYQARRSVSETITLLITSKEIDFIGYKDCEYFANNLKKIRRMINGLIRVTKNYSIKN